MRSSNLTATPRSLLLVSCLALGSLFLQAACSGGSGGGNTGGPSKPTVQGTQPPATPTPPASGTAPLSSSGAALNACSLLIKQEVAAAIGAPELEPKRDEFEERTSCLFSDPKAPGSELVRIDVVSYATVSGAKFGFEAGKGLLASSAEAKAVTGLGDDAYWADFVSTLGILKGNFEIRLRITAGEKQGRQNIAKGLAAKAISRLP